MECPPLVFWVAAEAVASALDFAVGRCRERLGELYQRTRLLRRQVHWYRRAVERFGGWWGAGRQLALVAAEFDLCGREYRAFSRIYRGYRRHQNRRWGLPDGAAWYALPAYARRGYRFEGL